jgi:hypothetical protein
MARKKKQSHRRVGDKIRVLRHEGVPEKQAVAESLSMERAGRLRKGGRYVHVSRASKKRRGRRSSRA